MMDHQTKKNIRILAEKYDHAIRYDQEVIILESAFNRIEIRQKTREELTVSFNCAHGWEKLDIPHEEIYDIIIEVFRRNETQVVERKNYLPVLTLDSYIQEEGDFASDALKKLRSEIKNKGLTHKKLGGNRIEAEYYNGIIILTDDIMLQPSNVIAFE
jgi:hypothetical protein